MKEVIDLNKEVVKLRQDERLSDYFASDEIVQRIFKENPTNKNLYEVALKIMAVDCFYNTNIRYKRNGYLLMAQHIVNLSENNFLDDLISKGDKKAVELIRNCNGLKCYSFASKYCCLSNKNDDYYIYDSLVCEIMYRFAREKNLQIGGRAITKKQLGEYVNYFNVCEDYKKEYNLEGTRRDMDWYLWGKQKTEHM